MLTTLIFIFILFCVIFILIGKIRPRLEVIPNGKVVLITGCDSGFGNRLAQRLNQMGFKVYATVLNTQSSGAKELKTNAFSVKKMIVLKMDVTNDTEVKEVYNKVKNELQSDGHVLWAVVNNAGILTCGLLDWGSLESYRKLFEVNVFGTVLVTRVFLPLIKASKGRIINMASFSGRISFKYVGIYSMTKHSLIAFSDTLRRELYHSGVNVCSIEPGRFRTHISSSQNIIKQLVNSWNESTIEVKNCHGHIKNHVKHYLNLTDAIPSEENIDVVVNDMIDAITNCRPKAIYSPMGLIFKITKYVFHYLPTEFMDWLLYRFDKIFSDQSMN